MLERVKDLFKGVPHVMYKSDDGGHVPANVLVDENGDPYSDSNPIPTEVDTTGLATEAKQDSIIAAITAVGATVLLIWGALQGTISTGNSSTTPLGAGATFTGTSVSILDKGTVFISVTSDVASATDGLQIQQSTDNTNWDFVDNYTLSAGSAKNYAINPHAEYLRVVYTNGATPQTYFRLQTVLKSISTESSHRINDSITTEDDARLVKAVVAGEDGGGAFYNAKVTQDGLLSVSDESSGLSIARGNVTGVSFIHKFGSAPDFDNGDGFVTIWDGAEDGTAWENMQYDYSATADIGSCSSDNAGDTQEIEVQGLDTNYALTTQTVTLNGQSTVTLTTDLIRIFRVKNNNSTDFAGHIFCFVNGTTTTGGVPDTASNIRSIIQIGNNQTEMAVYTIPAGFTGYMRSWYASSAGANRNSNYVIRLVARPFGGVFQLKHRASISDTGSSYIQHGYVEPEVFTEKTDLEMFTNMTLSSGTSAAVSGGFDIVLVEN